LNEYGIATYKTVDGFAQKEVDWLLAIGGIELHCNQQLGRDIQLDALVSEHDAVFLGLGLGGVNSLGIDEPQPVRAAVDFIAELRQAASPADVPVGRRVLVIGGGMTAIDAAVQSKLLGAEEATIVYRRGPESMPASLHEQQWAQTRGVLIRHWAAPKQLLVDGGHLRGMRFVRTRVEDGKLIETSDSFDLAADVVLKAIGQTLLPDALGPELKLRDGRIATDVDGRSSHPKIWAGGDCRHGGRDLTVEAVQHGKLAAIDIDRVLRG
jgi:dihydropyrimidine dehydrogenase (NAD+) subunit PreT